MRPLTPDDRKAIVVGRPLPFSIYANDNKLLLAAGRIVPNEFVREGLIRSGAFSGEESGEFDTPTGSASQLLSGPLADLQSDYKHTVARLQSGFRMEREGLALRTRVIGVSEDGSGLIMSGPTNLEGNATDIAEGATWTFRALYAVSAVRFQATVGQVSAKPFRYFYVSQLTDIDTRNVRQWPRALTALWTSRTGEAPRIMTDLSVGGARVAGKDNPPLQQGQTILVSPSLKLAVGAKELSLEATVINLYGRSDPRHPQIAFYGVRFDKLVDWERLTLHAYVQENLCMELDRVWHVLAVPAH